MTKTSDYEITDYGIENADYFQGHGTSFTRYQHCSLGCGDTYSEALEDALDGAAQQGYDVELQAEDRPENWEGKGPSASAQHDRYCDVAVDDEDGKDHSDCESNLYYYVGLRWN